MYHWILSHEAWIRNVSSALVTIGSIVLAFRVKELITLIANVLNSHEQALREIKDLSENPQWDNTGRISTTVGDGLNDGMAVAIEKFNAKKGAILLYLGFGCLALGGAFNLGIGLLKECLA
ncbi:hypothetical protein [Serratia marcescens]|uniref:hypothetical protein n=1 Tax=Serratia marcescens TaxID=615 RepID=UPI0007C95EBD|nr:hypothetical protein [Serratia marcescens]OAH29132.1 hypothetical protein AYJ10_05790 [Serratia marcescens]